MKQKFLQLSIAIAIFLNANQAFSQGGEVGFKETTNYSQEFKDMIRTSDGGILATGGVGLSGRVFKMNGNYVEQWCIGLDSTQMQFCIETNDGNYVILCRSFKSIYNGEPVVIKITPSGTILYSKIYAVPNNVFTADGICKAAGTDSGFVFFGGNCVAMHYLQKCDKDGNIQWVKQHLGLGNGLYMSILPEANGYVGAYTHNPDVGIARMDASGNVTSTKVLVGTNQVALFYHCLTKKNNGDYYLWTASGDVYGLQNYSISNNFSTITCKKHVTSTQIYPTSVLAMGNSNDEILITGTYSFGLGIYMKMSSSDNIVYQKGSNAAGASFNKSVVLGGGKYAMGGAYPANGKSVSVVDDNGVGVCSTFNLNLTSSTYNFTTTVPTITNYTPNVTVMPFTPVTTTVIHTRMNICGALSADELLNEGGINLYPNPTNKNVQLQFNSPVNGKALIDIVDITGRVVAQEVRSVSEGETILELDLTGISEGIYLVKFNLDGRIFTRKVMKSGNE